MSRTSSSSGSEPDRNTGTRRDGARGQDRGHRSESGSRRNEEPQEVAALRAELDQVERRVISAIDPGVRALVIAVGALVLLLAAVLPWVESAPGWDVLLGAAEPGQHVGVLPRLFAGASLLGGVLLSALTLVLRRWGLAWVCALVCSVATVLGVLAVWTQQTSEGHVPGPGPGAGLVVALLAQAVIAVQWLRIAWSRPS